MASDNNAYPDPKSIMENAEESDEEQIGLLLQKGRNDMQWVLNKVSNATHTHTHTHTHTPQHGVPTWCVSSKSPLLLYSKVMEQDGKAGSAEKLKEKGNEAFRKKDYHVALVCYSDGLSLTPNAVLFGNRSATYLKLDRPLQGMPPPFLLSLRPAKHWRMLVRH